MERSNYEHWKAKDVARVVAVAETSRRYYQEILALAPVGLLVVSSRLTFVMANRHLRDILDLHGQELGSLSQVLPLEPLRKLLIEVLATGKSRHGLIFDLPGPKGSRTLRLDLEHLESWHGEEREVLVFLQDVTSYGEPATIANIPAIVWEADVKESRFTLINAAAESLLGYPGSRWLAEPAFWPERIHAEDRSTVLELYAASIADRADRICEYRAISASAAVVWLRETIHPVADESGEIRRLVGVATDITEHRDLYERSLIFAKTDALARAAAGIGQDFSNLLTIISGYTQEIATQPALAAVAQADLANILAASERASVLANQLLAYAFREPREARPFDLRELLADLLTALRKRLPPGLILEIETGAAPLYVQAHADDVKEAVSALTEYAGESISGTGDIAIEVGEYELTAGRALPQGLAPGEYAVIKIRYTGRELSEEAKRSLFEPVFRAGPPPSSNSIANAHRTIRLNGGDVAIHIEPTGRTSIRIYVKKAAPIPPSGAAEIPRAEVAESLPPVEGAPETGGRLERAYTVFVVDDEESVRTLIARTLRTAGYRVVEASDGRSALEIAGAHSGSIDLLVTDVVMPGMNGREFADRLTTLRPGVKVLYVSGYTNDAVIRSGLLPPGTAFLQKPFPLASLLEKVREMLESTSHRG